ncbi:MAG: hypothetical protein C0511_15230 [Hyphomicrobium sp.]|nr:hypothetical protein [Hyphomicrobium sp.]
MYRTLDPDRIIATLEQLERRIKERFPDAGIGRVCAELTDVARESRARIAAIARPNRLLRLVNLVLMLAGVAMLVYFAGQIDFRTESNTVFGIAQGFEALINVLVLVGAGGLFLFTTEERTKRRRALEDLHELRAIVHVIDMHQLTKDPSTTTASRAATPSSPTRQLTPFELVRYLDYCSEMLSLVSKVTALYAQSFPDAVVVEAVNDIEQLTTNLSQKIWQKINILDRELSLVARAAEAAGPKPAAG